MMFYIEQLNVEYWDYLSGVKRYEMVFLKLNNL